jgi:3-hydroxybutyryl-CoA dehydrogenase
VGASSVGTVGIVGAGRMGAGIAQVAIEAGHAVVLEDTDPAALERGVAAIRSGLSRRAARLDLDPDSIDDWVEGRASRLHPASSLDDLAGADLVIEAAIEDLAIKRGIVAALDGVLAPDAIVATNTSALSVAEIAAGSTRPARVVGLHFFNPAPLMALVEVVAAPTTDPAVAERAANLMTAWGKTAVRAADTPGFIVNRVNRPFTIEALRMLEAGVAGVEAIDDAMRTAGFPMGPFELMDLTGIDVTLAAARSIWERLGRPERLRPSPIQERQVAAGRLGRSSGAGFYAYTEGRRGAVWPVFAGVGPGLDDVGIDDAAIAKRILGAIDAEARLAVADGVASEADVDLALRLGAGHPTGPFERARAGTGSHATIDR